MHKAIIDYLIICPTKDEFENIMKENQGFKNHFEIMTNVYFDDRLQWSPNSKEPLRNFVESYGDEYLQFNCQTEELSDYLNGQEMDREEKKVFNNTKVFLFDMLTVLSSKFNKYWFYINESIYADAIDPRCCFVFNENMPTELITYIQKTLKENNDFILDIDQHYAKGRMHKLAFRSADLHNFLSYVTIGVHDSKLLDDHPFTRDGRRPRRSEAKAKPEI